MHILAVAIGPATTVPKHQDRCGLRVLWGEHVKALKPMIAISNLLVHLQAACVEFTRPGHDLAGVLRRCRKRHGDLPIGVVLSAEFKRHGQGFYLVKCAKALRRYVSAKPGKALSTT